MRESSRHLLVIALAFAGGCFDSQTFSPEDPTTNTFGYLGALNDSYAAIAETSQGGVGVPVRHHLHFFERSGTQWARVQRTEISLPSAPGFFQDVAIDGEDLLVGVGLPGSRVNNHGYAMLWQRGAPWREFARFSEPGSADTSTGTSYGSAVDISGDTAVVGAPDWDLEANGVVVRHGQVFVYRRVGGVWERRYAIAVARDHGQLGTAYRFGTDVELDGQTLVVTAGIGRLYVYRLTASGYALEWETEDFDREDRYKISLSGSTLAVINRAGDAVVVRERTSSGAWNEVQRIRWDDRPGRPMTVSVSATGLSLAFAGAGYGATSGRDAVRVYERTGEGYTLLSELEPGGGARSLYLTSKLANGSMLVGRGDAATFYTRR